MACPGGLVGAPARRDLDAVEGASVLDLLSADVDVLGARPSVGDRDTVTAAKMHLADALDEFVRRRLVLDEFRRLEVGAALAVPVRADTVGVPLEEGVLRAVTPLHDDRRDGALVGLTVEAVTEHPADALDVADHHAMAWVVGDPPVRRVLAEHGHRLLG